MLLHGYRGSGKTSLLRKIAEVTRRKVPRAIVVEVQPRAETGEQGLWGLLSEETRHAAAGAAGRPVRIRTALQRVTSVSVLGSGVALKEPRPKRPDGGLSRWKETLRSVAGSPLVLLEIDDAEALADSGLVALKTVAEMESPVPILLVVAGGPELVERMAASEHSPVLRNFSGAMFDIGRLDLRETAEALRAPLRADPSDLRWDDEAVERVYRLTHGFPYLVQCVAHAAFRDSGDVHATDVETAVPRALAIASDWMDRELPRASDEDLRAFVRISDLDRQFFSASEALHVGVGGVYLGRLVRLRVLRKVARGRYELVRSPVLAYYHALRRELDAPSA